MHWTKLSSILLRLLLIVALNGQRRCLIAAAASSDGQTEQDSSSESSSSADEEPELKLDPSVIRDAIASVLRSSDGVSEANNTDSSQDDGYAEAAQEYLEHVQTVLASAAAPIEIYIREQLADLNTLSQLLTELSRRRLDKKSALRLAARLLKGPAKELILPTLTGQSDEAASESGYSYLNSKTAQLLTDASKELTNFFSESDEETNKKDSGSLTDRLKSYGEKLGSEGPIREYLDGVLDRMLELEGRKVRFNVEFPDAKSDDEGAGTDVDNNSEFPSLGEPRVSRLPDHEEDDQQDSPSASSSTSSAEEDGGRNLFDQVLCRRAAESVAAALAEDAAKNNSSSESARLRIQQLRQRQYQPAGLDAMLEAIEDCLL